MGKGDVRVWRGRCGEIHENGDVVDDLIIRANNRCSVRFGSVRFFCHWSTFFRTVCGVHSIKSLAFHTCNKKR